MLAKILRSNIIARLAVSAEYLEKARVLLRCLEEAEDIDYAEQVNWLQETKDCIEEFTQGFMAKGVEEK